MTRAVCECGRPAVVRPAIRKKSSRKARAGRPVALKDHPTCQQCWERQCDSWFGSGQRGVKDVAKKGKDRWRVDPPAIASEPVMRFLMRLWAGDRLAVRGGEVWHLRTDGMEFRLDTELLDEVEDRRWVKALVENERVELTVKGREALRVWAAKARPESTRMRNDRGETITLAGVPGRRVRA